MRPRPTAESPSAIHDFEGFVRASHDARTPDGQGAAVTRLMVERAWDTWLRRAVQLGWAWPLAPARAAALRRFAEACPGHTAARGVGDLGACQLTITKDV